MLEFVGATCPHICPTLGTASGRLGSTLAEDARMLSISFGPSDDTELLGSVADRPAAVSLRWRVTGIAEGGGRAALLESAAVVVIQDGEGGLLHAYAAAILAVMGWMPLAAPIGVCNADWPADRRPRLERGC